jgi:hypothetical protein
MVSNVSEKVIPAITFMVLRFKLRMFGRNINLAGWPQYPDATTLFLDTISVDYVKICKRVLNQ